MAFFLFRGHLLRISSTGIHGASSGLARLGTAGLTRRILPVVQDTFPTRYLSYMIPVIGIPRQITLGWQYPTVRLKELRTPPRQHEGYNVGQTVNHSAASSRVMSHRYTVRLGCYEPHSRSAVGAYRANLSGSPPSMEVTSSMNSGQHILADVLYITSICSPLRYLQAGKSQHAVADVSCVWSNCKIPPDG